ncbi:MAG: DUF3999 family protein [Thermoanaerobaculia bacterium]
MIARLVCAALLVAVSASGDSRYERPIHVTTPGAQRLEVDLALLAGATKGFADLRISDPIGREVPYLIVQPRPGGAEWIGTKLLPIARTRTYSGMEADARKPVLMDALRIDGIAAPFLKRVRIEGSGDRQRWTLLADTTVFDLPQQELRRTEVEFPASELRYLRLTWNDSSSAPVSGDMRVFTRVHGSALPAMPLRTAVPFASRPSEPGRSRYRIDLPASALPVTAIHVKLPAADVFREATVSEPRLTATEIIPVILGRGHLRQAQRDGQIASQTRIAISSPQSRELDLVIDDSANPPMTIQAVELELAPQPWIYFEADSAGTYAAIYGDADAEAPRYDLEAARPFVGRSRISTAKLESEKRLDVPSTEPAAPLPAVGARLDPSTFRVARAIRNARSGMSTLALDADALARSNELSDVRIVDGENRQIPYIVERRSDPVLIDVAVGARSEREGNVSLYSLGLPYSTFPSGTKLVLTTSASVFERAVDLRDASDEGRDPRVIGSATWRHTDPGRLSPPLTFDLPTRVARDLELRIVDGDNAPLPITGAKLVLPAVALRFIHPGSPLTLLYGNAEVRPPRYDLALIAPRLFREPAQELTFASKIVGDAGRAEGDGERRFFWIAIGAIAIVLLVLLGRLLRPLTHSGPV